MAHTYSQMALSQSALMLEPLENVRIAHCHFNSGETVEFFGSNEDDHENAGAVGCRLVGTGFLEDWEYPVKKLF